MRLLQSAVLSVGLLAVAARAEASVVSAMPPTVTFPNTGVGAQSADVTVTFTNTSNAQITIAALVFIGANPGDFTITNQQFPPPFALGPGVAVPVTIAFKPVAGGARTATFEAQLGNGMGVTDVPVSGTAIGPKLTVAPNPINGGGSKVNVTTPISVVVSNTGGSVINIPMGGIVVNGPNANEFVLSNAPAGAVVLGPAGQGAVTLKINYTPTFQGVHTANLAITNDDPNAKPTLNVPITGKAGDPTIFTDIGTAAFGNVRIGLSSQPQPINISNTGNSDLHISAITVDGGQGGGGQPQDFPIVNPQLPITLAVGASAMMSVTFKPSATGTRTGRIVITSDDPNTPNKFIGMFGTGTQSIVGLPMPSSLDFGTQRIYTPGMPKTVTIANSGTDDANITNVVASGPNKDWFRTNGILMYPIKIPKMGMATLNLVGLPLGLGAGTGSIDVTVDDPAAGKNGVISIPVKVTGVGGTMNVSPSFIDYGSIGVLSNVKQTITVENTGTDVLTVSNYNLIDMNTVFTLGPSAFDMTPTVLMPMMKVTIDVTCSPQAAMSYTGEIDFDTDDPMARHVHIPLDCTGATAGIKVDPAMGLNFGQINTGNSSSPMSITLSNTGGAPATVTSITLAGTNPNQFSCAPPATPFAVNPNAMIQIPCSYQPVSAGNHAAKLVITPQGFTAASVNLAGVAVTPTIVVATNPPGNVIDFGNVTLGGVSDPQPIGLHVPTTSPMVQIASITSSNPSEFIVDTTGTTLNIGPNGTTTFTVQFKPNMAMSRTGSITVQLKGVPGNAGMPVQVKGVGVQSVATPRGGSCSVSGRSSYGDALLLLCVPGVAALLRRRRRRA